MAGSRTLKLSILADVDDLRKKLGEGSKEVETFGSKLGGFAKTAGLAFAAAGAAAAAYAGKLLVDGVKSAIEDEKAQAALAKTLKNVTGATQGQIKATENYISKTSIAFGVTDEQLRPSLDRLVRSTKDLTQAQKLQGLALDIAAGSGKSLEAVSAALAKGFEGNTSALSRLGIGLSAAELKSMSFEEVTGKLADTFGGQASAQADTFAGKMERLKIAFDEGKETVGSFVLDAITPMVTLFVDKVIPLISNASNEIGKNLKPAFEDIADFFVEYLIPIFKQWWDFLTNIVIPGIIKTVRPIFEGLMTAFKAVASSIKDNETKLKPLFDLFKVVAEFVFKSLAPALGTTLGAALQIVGNALSKVIGLFSNLVSFISRSIQLLQEFANTVANNPIVQGIGNVIGGITGTSTSVPLGGGSSTTNNTIVNVSGAIDPISTARTIQDVLKNEASLSGNFIGGLGISRFAPAV